MINKKRLDLFLYEKGLAISRERAKSIIMSGIVYVNDQKADKAGFLVEEEDLVEVRGKGLKYVSRGGYKLEKALDYFEVSPEDLTVIDIGASTGGFTDCLLQRCAKRVIAVDVGYGQLAWSLRTNPKVSILERTNIRYVTKDQIGTYLDLAVIDVSFISLKLVLPVVKTLLKPNGEVLCLVKPQFEAGRDKVGKKGVVREPAIHEEVLTKFIQNANEAGFNVKGITFSPIKGPEGNIEFLAYLESVNEMNLSSKINCEEIVRTAHEELKG